MACGTWPENIINFRSGLTNNKPTVEREEVLVRPAVGWSRAVGTQMHAGCRRKGDNNPQRGNALKLSTAHIKEKERKRKEIQGKKERGMVKHIAT